MALTRIDPMASYTRKASYANHAPKQGYSLENWYFCILKHVLQEGLRNLGSEKMLLGEN